MTLKRDEYIRNLEIEYTSLAIKQMNFTTSNNITKVFGSTLKSNKRMAFIFDGLDREFLGFKGKTSSIGFQQKITGLSVTYFNTTCALESWAKANLTMNGTDQNITDGDQTLNGTVISQNTTTNLTDTTQNN